ncbi:MAG TPA: hypothetical protein VIA18_27060 [Polyangia bacterium]|jgi:hypothetical protein|nr:hypothetical protein [Polyangia bacterium]
MRSSTSFAAVSIFLSFSLGAFSAFVSGCNTDAPRGNVASASLGQACTTDADCAGNEACLAQVCVPELPLDAGIPLCTTSADCSTGEICEHSICLPHQIYDGGVALCAAASDCATGEQCLGGVCLPTINISIDLGILSAGGIGQPCQSKSDCTAPLSCAFGACLPFSGCQTDADCTTGLTCHDSVCL